MECGAPIMTIIYDGPFQATKLVGNYSLWISWKSGLLFTQILQTHWRFQGPFSKEAKNIFCRVHKDLDHDIEKISAARYFPPFHHWPIANSKELILIAEHYCWLAKSHQIKQVYENSSNSNIRPIVVTWCHRHSLVTLTKP